MLLGFVMPRSDGTAPQRLNFLCVVRDFCPCFQGSSHSFISSKTLPQSSAKKYLKIRRDAAPNTGYDLPFFKKKICLTLILAEFYDGWLGL